MAIFNLFKNFGKAKAGQLAEQAAEMLARIDPDTMSEAAILEVEEKFTAITQEVARLRRDYEQEKREADEIEALQNRRMAAAERIQAKLNVDPESQELQTALEQLVAEMEQGVPLIEKEKREAADAEAYLHEVESVATEISRQLLGLRKQVDDAKKTLARAELEKDRQARREEQAKAMAHIRSSTSGFSKALEKMNQAAESAGVDADAARLRADLLSQKSSASGNVVVEAALKEVDGQKSESLSLCDRLAKLRK